MSNILVVDDEEAIAQVIEQTLTNYGFNVDTAYDGIEGIEKFDKGLFDLIITDLCMPGIDGNGLAEHISNSDRRSTQIIGISGTSWLTENSSFDSVIS